MHKRARGSTAKYQMNVLVCKYTYARVRDKSGGGGECSMPILVPSRLALAVETYWYGGFAFFGHFVLFFPAAYL